MQTLSRGNVQTVGFVKPSLPGKWIWSSERKTFCFKDRHDVQGIGWQSLREVNTVRILESYHPALTRLLNRDETCGDPCIAVAPLTSNGKHSNGSRRAMNKFAITRPHENRKAQELIEKIQRKREPQRTLRLIGWVGTTPVRGVCTTCAEEFRIPQGTMTRASEAEESLKSQFRW